MSLDAFSVIYPNQRLNGTDLLELVIPEFTGMVRGTIERRSVAAPFVDWRSVRGTATVVSDAIGESTLQVLVPGVTPDGLSDNQRGRVSLTVDTTVLARGTVPLLDDFQTNDPMYRNRIAMEHGTKIAKLYDQSVLIQAAKAAALTIPAYGVLPGHLGGSTQTLAAAGDITDPAAIYAAIKNLLTQMMEKDVDPAMDGVMIALRPSAFGALLDAEQVINMDYMTSMGNVIKHASMLKAFGVPVMSSNNLPTTNITNHVLSNTRNANAYNGDFTKLVGVAFSPMALLAGQTIPVTSKLWYDDLSKSHYIDSWLAYGVTPDKVDYAGRIVLP
jgi:hypothetical protein